LIKNPFPLQTGQVTIPYFSGVKFLSISIFSYLIESIFPVVVKSTFFSVHIPSHSNPTPSRYVITECLLPILSWSLPILSH
jgi:hypothetical protein